MIPHECDHCGHIERLPNSTRGSKHRCKKCGRTSIVTAEPMLVPDHSIDTTRVTVEAFAATCRVLWMILVLILLLWIAIVSSCPRY